MRNSASGLAVELGFDESETTGFYIRKAIELPSSHARALPKNLKLGVMSFIRFVAKKGYPSFGTIFIGDTLIEQYDEEIIAASMSQTTRDHRRNSCVAIVNLARDLAIEDGHEVGPPARRRPLEDPRRGPVASTVERLAQRGEFGHYLTRALEAKRGDGEFRFHLSDIACVRVFITFIDESDPQRCLVNTEHLGSAIVSEFKQVYESRGLQVQYVRKCVRLADRLMVDAMQLAIGDGKTVGPRFAIPFSDDRPIGKDQAARNARRIAKIEKAGPLQAQIAAAVRLDAVRLIPGTIHATLSNIQPLLRYLTVHPEITSLDHITEPHLIAIFESICGEGRKTVTSRGVWSQTKRTLLLVEEMAAQGPVHRSKIPWPQERWPSEERRRGNADQGLSPIEAASLERLARKDIAEVLLRRERMGQLFSGPYVEDLQAFELLLAFRTGFNPGTVRTLNISDIRRVDTNVEVSGTKLRSANQPLAVFAASDAPFSGPWLLEKIQYVTSLARERALPQHKDRLFLFERKVGAGQGRARPFDPQKMGTENKMLADFGRRAGIEGLTLRTMRASFSNLAFAVSGDDVHAVKRLMGHRSSGTTEDYSRDHNKGPRQEVLAEAMERRLRDARTDMRRDSRDRPTATLSGATPGFACLDPYRPPDDLVQLPGMCAAYGACPTCPQASVDISLPSSACDLVLMADAIKTWIGKPEADPRRIIFWRQQLDALEKVWLPRFSPQVLSEAMQIRTARAPSDGDFLHD